MCGRHFGKASWARHAALVAAFLTVASFGLHGSSEHRAHLSSDLARHQARKTSIRRRVIVRGTESELNLLASRHHVQILKRWRGAAVVLANSGELTALSRDRAVDTLSGDLPVHGAMAVSLASTAADQTQLGNAARGIPGVDGQGVGVAVIDSGIAAHDAFGSRVVANVSFVSGDPQTDDLFGHGTHVAGIIGGAATAGATPLYTGGMAPGVQFVNVRVLGADGSGYTSDVIAGIEWVLAHRGQYNIRVINLSVGHPVVESCATDPLCQEVNKAAQAGIVVVIAAGNYGKAPDGRPILGSIASPGNSPYAITVGALNTWQTVDRSDDTLATFSSRGPSQYDLAVKPDLVAPGTKIVSLEASGAYLPTLYPNVHVAGSGTNAYMYLSGTSMAAPMVSGAAALLIQGNPALTPAQVKFALQSGAAYVPAAGLMGAGAGSLNVWASRLAAASQLASAVTTTIAGTPETAGGASFWDVGTLAGRLDSGVATRLLSMLDVSQFWSNTTTPRFGDLNLLGLTNPLAGVASTRLQYGAVAGWTSEQTIVWGTPMQDPSGQSILWGTSDDDSILWGTSDDDSILWGTGDDDSILWGTSLMTSPEAR